MQAMQRKNLHLGFEPMTSSWLISNALHTEYSREVLVGGNTSRSSVPLDHSGSSNVTEELDVSSHCVALPCPCVPVSPH